MLRNETYLDPDLQNQAFSNNFHIQLCPPLPLLVAAAIGLLLMDGKIFKLTPSNALLFVVPRWRVQLPLTRLRTLRALAMRCTLNLEVPITGESLSDAAHGCRTVDAAQVRYKP